MSEDPVGRLIKDLGVGIDPRTSAVIRELPALTKYLRSRIDYAQRMARHEQAHPGFQQWFETYAASLKYDWTRVSRIPRQQVRKRVRALKVACTKAARLMAKHEAEYFLWHGLPASALSFEASLADTLHHAATDISPMQLIERMACAGDVSARALPLVSRALAALADSIDLRALPLTLQILPTKLGDTEARGVYFVRALTWFFISNMGKPDDEVVSLVASYLAHRQKEISPDHVAIIRRRLMKTLGRS